MQQLGPLETRLVVFTEYFKLPAVCTHGRIAFSGPPVFAGPTWLVTGDDPCHFQERALFHCPRETLPREVQVGGRRVTVTNRVCWPTTRDTEQAQGINFCCSKPLKCGGHLPRQHKLTCLD